jgi:2-(1,2-epoxy-1,2-dihydrophenyl)acetyl-CoA isomerase
MRGELHVLTEVAGGIGTITLNRPEKMNSFFGSMRDEIADAVDEMAVRDDVRVVVVTGRGRAFCTGADVGYLAGLLERGDYDEANALVTAGRRVVGAITSMPKPVIASLNGPAAGGGANLALACDLRIASDRFSIGQTFNRIGLHPDWGGTWLLPRLVGRARAAELFFFGDMIDAEEALRIGIVNRVVPHAELEAATRDWAQRLAAKPVLPLALAKRALHLSSGAALDEMLDYEGRAQDSCFRSADAVEGTRAFMQKRSPEFGAGS